MRRVFLILIGSLIAATIVLALSGPALAGVGRALCVAAGDQCAPDIWGDRIVWADNRSGVYDDYDIYMKDLHTGLETAICTAAGNQTNPAIWGNRVVWEDYRVSSDDPNIHMYDLATGVETQITTNSERQMKPAIHEDRIVWQDGRSGGNDIYMYDLATAVETAICTDVSDQTDPDIYGDHVAWVDRRGVGFDIYAYDLATHMETWLTAYYSEHDFGPPSIWEERAVYASRRSIAMYDFRLGGGGMLPIDAQDVISAQIWGDRVIWSDRRNGTDMDVYMYDMLTWIETVIAVGVRDQSGAVMFGDRIAYRSATVSIDVGDVFMYDVDPSWGERAITVVTSHEDYPAVFGHRIVWGDSRNGNHDIYMYDLAAGAESVVCMQTGEQWHPAIWGERVAWMDQRDGNWDIYVRDLALGTETAVCTQAASQWSPAIWGARVVWHDYRSGNYDIYMNDLYTAVETAICTAAGTQAYAAIFGDRIVWQDFRNGNWDIYMYDLATATETPICTQAAAQENPAIYGDRIVWQDWRNGSADIYMYDLATATEAPICSQAADQYFPKIWGDRVVWHDHRGANVDIYMYDLATAAETPICTAADNQFYPAIWSDRIVWQDNRNGNQDIYMQKLATVSFDDVVRTHTFWPQIEAIFAHSVAEGTSAAPPMYSPASVTTRGQMASFICKAFSLTWYDPGAPTFTDVPRGSNGTYDNPETDGTHIFYGYVERLKQNGVTGGIGGGLYGVSGNITRGQMAVFMCKAAGKTPLVSPTPRFADVPSSHPFYGWIERLADAGSWGAYGPPTAGTSPTTFSPAATCTRGHMAAFIQRAREFELPVR